MRSRRREWDVAMPDALVSDAWNERELEQIRDGLIARVDGFFGHPTPIDHDGSGVPLSLRTVPVDR